MSAQAPNRAVSSGKVSAQRASRKASHASAKASAASALTKASGAPKHDLDARAEAELQAALSGALTATVLHEAEIELVDIKALRRHLGGLSQTAFAERFGFSLGAVRNWEQGRRIPEKSARLLLRAIAEAPDFVAKLVAEDAKSF